MRQFIIIVVIIILSILIPVTKANHVNHEVLLNSDYFYRSAYENSLNLSIKANDKQVDLFPSGDFFHKNPAGEYAQLTIPDETFKTLQINEPTVFKLQFDLEPTYSVIYFKNHKGLHYQSIEELLASIEQNGIYPIMIEATWEKSNNKDYYGRLVYEFNLDVTLLPELQIKTNVHFPGNILVLSVENIKEDYHVELNTDLSHGSIALVPIEDSLVYFIPIDIWSKSGDYSVSVEISSVENKSIANLTGNIKISDKKFVTQYLYISEEVYETTNSDAAYQEFREKAQAARSTSTMKKLWDGPFLLPVKDAYTLTTDYGEIRYVNDHISSTRHSGLDLASPTGTKIYACNSGNVVLSEYLILTGNTLIIDHGMGLFTSYYHMDSLSAKLGDFVNKGDFVGNMGSTGFSTGPHLHWSISIYNTYVNPWQVLESDLYP